MSGRPFEVVQPTPNVVQQPPTPQPTVAPDSRAARDAAVMLRMALGALAQRTLVAISDLFTLAGVGLTWWLLFSVLPEPRPLQLVGIGGWALFLLIVEVVRRK